MVCVIDKDSVGDNSTVNFNTDGIEFKGDVYNLMDNMEQTVIKLKLLFIEYSNFY